MGTKREGELKAAFGRELKRVLPTFYVLLHSTGGAPDRSITGGGKTTLWECKHGTPDFESQGNQELLCERLSVAGYCRYVIWQEDAHGGGKRTMIVHPRGVRLRSGWHVVPEAFCVGYDMLWLVRYIAKVHGC